MVIAVVGGCIRSTAAKLVLTLALLVLSSVSSYSTVTINLFARDLQTTNGSPLPTSGLVVLVASTTNSTFEGPTDTLFASGDDVVLRRWNLSSSETPGLFLDTTGQLALTNQWNQSDALRLYWFPTLTTNATVPGLNTSFGAYSDLVGVDGSDPWTTPGEGATISLSFLTANQGGSNPQTAGRAAFKVATNTQPLAATTPGSINFGSVLVGQTNSQGFIVVNNGGGTLTGSAVSAAPFSIASGSPFTLTKYTSSNLVVRFVPSGLGAFSNTVIITSNGGNLTNVVTGTGISTSQLQVTPGSINFGFVATGTTAQAAFVVTNTGGSALSGTAGVGTPFGIVSGASFNLAGFAKTNVVVSFTPPNASAFSNSVIFASAAGNSTNAVLGIGAVAPAASFAATPTNGFMPLAVTFNDTSTGTITNRTWSFGTGSITNLTSTNVVQTYAVNPPGDVNRDGRVTGGDSLLINQVIVNLRSNTSPVFVTNFTVRLVVSGPLGASTNTQPSLIGLNIFPNGDVNQTSTVTGGDPLLINQVIVGLRSYIVTKNLPSTRINTNTPTPVTIYGIGFPTNGSATATIGAPVNLTLSNVVVVNREQITAIVPAGGGTGTGVVNVTAFPSNSVISFGRFINP